MWTSLKRVAGRWRHRHGAHAPVTRAGVAFEPVNDVNRDPACIDADVDFAIKSAQLIIILMRNRGVEPKGLHFLELGPGVHFGAPLILVSMGMRVSLADRFLARWQDQYHPAFYRQLNRTWDGPNGAIQAVVDANGYPDAVLTLREEAGESMVSVPAASVDFTYSNAVLEHVVDMRAVGQELSRVMRQGAIGAHQVDMRGHADFDRPLEHVVMPDDEYGRKTVHGFEAGNRLRPSEFIALFEHCGLQVTEFDANCVAQPAYLSDAVGRLRVSASSYRSWPEEDLAIVGGRFFIRRVDGCDAEALEQSAAERLQAQAQRKRSARDSFES